MPRRPSLLDRSQDGPGQVMQETASAPSLGMAGAPAAAPTWRTEQGKPRRTTLTKA